MDGRVVLAVDGNSLVHRSYHAQASTGQPMWAVRGLLGQLVAAVERVRPTCVVVGFDDPQRSARRERWPAYKAQRAEKLDTLVEQLGVAVESLRRLGVRTVVPDGWEADDVLASTAAAARAAGARTVVVTSDRDAFALIDEHTSVLRVINGGVDASPTMTPERLVLLLGVRPAQYRDFAALRGDPSDNLPGVRGIGTRTAARLLAEFGTAAAAFADLDAVSRRLGAGVARRLAADGAREAWQVNCQVMAMRSDLPLGDDLFSGAGVLPLDPGTVREVYLGHRLTWTAAQAARALGGADDAAVAVPAETAGWSPSWHSGSSGLSGSSGRKTTKPPRPVPRRPVTAQLSLF